jgi:hypothetical protein
MSEGEPSLKCVIAWSDRRHLCSLVAHTVEEHLGAQDVRPLGDDALLLYGTIEPDEIRDLLGTVLGPEESVLVFEFERWSARGPRIYAEWLMRRGH